MVAISTDVGAKRADNFQVQAAPRSIARAVLVILTLSLGQGGRGRFGEGAMALVSVPSAPGVQAVPEVHLSSFPRFSLVRKAGRILVMIPADRATKLEGLQLLWPGAGACRSADPSLANGQRPKTLLRMYVSPVTTERSGPVTPRKQVVGLQVLCLQSSRNIIASSKPTFVFPPSPPYPLDIA